ncbi:MAG: hypothetical protein CVU38_14765 [Chloroflexi bacterium HGW-Chloroflexi-1]|nr:MAG: hypothetical protein CVU38_14765 [Chloroflexi bacterium HGW-Chloroflexi-1]
MAQDQIRNPQSAIRNRTIRHFALHRIGPVELRVISDIEAGVIALTEVEEEVLRRYSSQPDWPHRVVSLFVLSDMSPLQRQLTRTAKLPPGGVAALAYRPVVNVYDLADSTACHIFINQTAMIKEGYWDDPLAQTALLAHEHGHPLAENATVRASRELALALGLSYREPLSTTDEAAWRDKLRRLLEVLTDKLTLYAPREIFTNDLVLRSEFTDALYHLDMINVRNAARAVQSRPALVAGLMAEPALTGTGRAAFLALADLKAHLDLALEIASFHRLDRAAQVRSLEQVLEATVFPALVPETAPAYRALIERYQTLTPDMTSEALAGFARQVVTVLADALRPYGVDLGASIVGRARSGDRPER